MTRLRYHVRLQEWAIDPGPQSSLQEHPANAEPTVMNLVALLVVLAFSAMPDMAGSESGPSSLAKGVFLVASPALNDPNFRETVVLILEHEQTGTVGVILNRATEVLLSETLPDVAALKGTGHRLFAGGPVQPGVVLLLSRVQDPHADMRRVFDSVYVGGSSDVLERILTRAAPGERFRALAGYAGWAPGQLELEMRRGAWAVLPPENTLFDKDPNTLWQESLARLDRARVISTH